MTTGTRSPVENWGIKIACEFTRLARLYAEQAFLEYSRHRHALYSARTGLVNTEPEFSNQIYEDFLRVWDLAQDADVLGVLSQWHMKGLGNMGPFHTPELTAVTNFLSQLLGERGLESLQEDWVDGVREGLSRIRRGLANRDICPPRTCRDFRR